jgi:hypothetical protein
MAAGLKEGNIFKNFDWPSKETYDRNTCPKLSPKVFL